ncbi:MAG: hypothetical protein GTN99_07585, partial [Candidatus Dadabacteria bacterium]|nr:hypothetical protein [Candidatus Dadabacteria bacterium]
DSELTEQDSPSEDFFDHDVSVSNQLMEMCLEGLRPIEREVLFLSAVEGYTAEEIAKLMEKP